MRKVIFLILILESAFLSAQSKLLPKVDRVKEVEQMMFDTLATMENTTAVDTARMYVLFLNSLYKSSSFVMSDSFAFKAREFMVTKADTANWIHVMYTWSYVKNRMGRYQEEIQVLLDADHLANEYGDPEWIAKIDYQRAWLNFYLANVGRCYELGKKVEVHAKEGLIDSSKYLNFIANVLTLDGKVEEALRMYDIGIAYAERNDLDGRVAVIVSNRADLLSNNGRHEEGIIGIQRALEINERKKSWHQYSGNMTILSKCYLKAGEPELALQTAKKALNKANEISSYRSQRGSHRMIYESAKELGQYELALIHLDTVFRFFNDYPLVSEYSDVLSRVYDIEVDNYQERIQVAEQEALIHQLKLEATQKSRLYGGVILIGLILFLATFLYRKQKDSKKEQLRSQQDYENRIVRMELRALRSQMNPHFIFNSLNSIKNYIIKNEARLATSYINKFSKLMRLILNHSKEEFVMLEKELESVRLYLDLEAMRFTEKFEYKIQIDPEVNAHMLLPPMVVQPFVENAVWHAFNGLDKKGMITIQVGPLQGGTEIIIQDNGIGRQKSNEIKRSSKRKHKGLGVEITQERIESLSNSMIQGGIHVEDVISNGNISGTKVALRLPAIDGVTIPSNH